MKRLNETLTLDIICDVTGRRYKQVDLPSELVNQLSLSEKEQGVTTTELAKVIIRYLAKKSKKANASHSAQSLQNQIN